MELMFRRGDRYAWAVGNSTVTSMPLHSYAIALGISDRPGP